MASPPVFTVIVPVAEGAAYLLPFTLEGIAIQKDKLFEVIFVDGTRKGFTVPLVSGVEMRVVPAGRSDSYAMMNQAILEARGSYLHFLTPGEYYISTRVFSFVDRFIRAHGQPDLVYGGGFIRHSLEQPSVFLEQITAAHLQGAGLPDGLQPYWFLKETVQMIGRFREKFAIEGGFDLICRLYAAKTLRKTFMRRILTDYEYRRPSSRWIVRRFQESLGIALLHFGLNRFLFLWIGKNCLRLVRWGWKVVKVSFWRENVAF